MGSKALTRVFLMQSIFTTSLILADAPLDCFSCTDITSVDDCHTTKTCLPSQSCYTEKYTQDGNAVFTLGCKEKVFCQGLDVTHLFGRRETSCTQCCALHGCNKYLCPLRFTAAPPPVDGAWSDWGPWERCSSTCGIGLQSRYRKCDNPPPASNGRLCLGDAKDVGLCNIPCTAGECNDLIDCSGYYRPEACNGIYSPWAHRYCPAHCGFCPTVSTPPCIDTIDNCKEYQSDVCTNQAFWQWRESHCRKYCGLC
ncbi:thrombospondin-1-like isoform X2 [Mercenaria mercenaria]|uniref:thrombospondin-1-like isoform X2 n=1 Tax=Mercenaria mercenaria TaxID=6596 RepID=UPI001E1D7F4B|nr:thrombospondin-1-like isoform X2 [Mercenaria mercenaria]